MIRPKLTGKIITPKDSGYSKARKNYNLSIDKIPCIIVYCQNEEDIKNALYYAKRNKLEFRVRSGGHDFEGNSNINYGMVIDISEMNYCKIDEENMTVTVGGGISCGEIYRQLAERDFTIPAGTCEDVGSCGLTSAGGIGFATRYLGLTCDNLLEITIINSNFDKLTANTVVNSDLFWAIKGSPGSNYGVVTSLKYKITEVKKATFFTVSFLEKDFKEVIDDYQMIGDTLDDRLTMTMVLSKNEAKEINLIIEGTFIGDPFETNDILNTIFSKYELKNIKISYLPYGEIVKLWGGGCFPPIYYKNSGGFLYENILEKDIEQMIKFIKAAPDGIMHYFEFLQLGGKVLRISSDSASFAYREAKFVLQIKSVWRYNSQKYESKLWSNTCKRFIDTITVGDYRGFTDFNIENWQKQYYGRNYEKLQEVKSKYDRNNFFKSYQGVQPLNYDFSELTGEVITKESLRYDELRKGYNLRLNYYPLAIVYVRNAVDVANAIKWARRNYVNIAIRCGGHSYESFSANDYGIIIDVSRLRNFKLDKKNDIVTIGSGFNLGDLYTALYKEGYQFTGGTCPGVGISGLALGGGVGLSSRLYGLACDNLLEIKLINGCGKLIVANNYINKDLFCACRGGGEANFGVVVELTFKVRRVNKISYISMSFGKEDRLNALLAYDSFMKNADKRVTIELTVNENGCDIRGFSYANVEETKVLIKPLLEIQNPTVQSVEYITFIDAVNRVGQSQANPHFFKNSSSYSYSNIPKEAFEVILRYVDNHPLGSNHSVMLIPLGGAVESNRCLNTSFAHRNAQMLIQYVARWNIKEQAHFNIEWTRELRKEMLKYTANAYTNFSDTDIWNYLDEYYGQNKYYLSKIKEKYENNPLFIFPQSIY